MAEFPDLIVFDCDMCLWSPEMYTLDSLPKTPVKGNLTSEDKGVVGAKNADGEVVKLFPGALKVLQDFVKGKFPENARIAAASSADTPFAVKCAYSAMEVLEVVPGVTVKEVFASGWEDGFTGNLQIGRSGKLSSNKVTHFTQLKKETKVQFDRMLFFDDNNWGDNCGDVEKGCPGVVAVATPHGLTVENFQEGIKKFTQKSKE